MNLAWKHRAGCLKKIAEPPAPPCSHPCHNPPSHIALSPGVYEHTCPACGTVTRFTVPMICW